MRRLHKAFLRYHDPDNWPILREALKRMGRADLIGNGNHHLIPAYQPLRTNEGRPARAAALALSHATHGIAETVRSPTARSPATESRLGVFNAC